MYTPKKYDNSKRHRVDISIWVNQKVYSTKYFSVVQKRYHHLEYYTYEIQLVQVSS